MINGIKVNKVIYKLLSSDDELKGIVNDNIFPLIANENTTFPFVVFSRTSLTTQYCKDGAYQDTVNIDVICVSDDYSQSLDIATCIRKILENIRYKEGEEINITESILTSVQEYTNEYSFIQELNFTLTIE